METKRNSGMNRNYIKRKIIKAATGCILYKGALKNFANFAEKHLCQSLFLIKCNFIQKETPAQVFSCEYCEIFRNTVFIEHLP